MSFTDHKKRQRLERRGRRLISQRRKVRGFKPDDARLKAIQEKTLGASEDATRYIGVSLLKLVRAQKGDAAQRVALAEIGSRLQKAAKTERGRKLLSEDEQVYIESMDVNDADEVLNAIDTTTEHGAKGVMAIADPGAYSNYSYHRVLDDDDRSYLDGLRQAKEVHRKETYRAAELLKDLDMEDEASLERVREEAHDGEGSAAVLRALDPMDVVQLVEEGKVSEAEARAAMDYDPVPSEFEPEDDPADGEAVAQFDADGKFVGVKLETRGGKTYDAEGALIADARNPKPKERTRDDDDQGEGVASLKVNEDGSYAFLLDGDEVDFDDDARGGVEEGDDEDDEVSDEELGEQGARR